MNRLHLIILLILSGSIKLGLGQSSNCMYIKYPVFLFENEEELEDDELKYIGTDIYANKDRSVFLGKEVSKEELLRLNNAYAPWIAESHAKLCSGDGIETTIPSPYRSNSLPGIPLLEKPAFVWAFDADDYCDVDFKKAKENNLPQVKDGLIFDFSLELVDEETGEIAYTLNKDPLLPKFNWFYEKWHIDEDGSFSKEVKAISIYDFNYSSINAFKVQQASKKGDVLLKDVEYNVMFDRQSSIPLNTLGRQNYDYFIYKLLEYAQNGTYRLKRITAEDHVMGNAEFIRDNFLNGKEKGLTYDEYLTSNDFNCPLFHSCLKVDSFPKPTGVNASGKMQYDPKDLDDNGNPRVYQTIERTLIKVTDIVGLRFYEDWYAAKGGSGIIKKVKAVEFVVLYKDEFGTIDGIYTYNFMMRMP